MKKIVVTVAIIMSINAFGNLVETKQQLKHEKMIEKKTNDKEAIEKVIKTYFNALNNSNVKEAVDRYTNDGVFMPKETPTSSGVLQLTKAYEHVFQMLNFIDMGYTIDELIINGEVAVVRTSSLGNMKILSNDVLVENATHRELFILKKIKGEWKISHYMFNVATPVKH